MCALPEAHASPQPQMLSACLQVCNEAEITELVKDSEQAVQTEYLEMRTHNKGMH